MEDFEFWTQDLLSEVRFFAVSAYDSDRRTKS